MLAEKIIFTIVTLYLLIVIFFKLIKKGDKIYIPILACGLIGIILGLIQILFDLDFNIFVKTIMYVMAIIGYINGKKRKKSFRAFLYDTR